MHSKDQDPASNKGWIDVTDPSPEEMNNLSDLYGLNQHIVRDCLQPEHLPKYEFVDEVHFLILRYYSRLPDKRFATIQELTNKVAIFFTEDFLITIHKEPVAFLELARKKYEGAKKNSSITDVTIRIFWDALETFDDPAGRISEQVDFFENNIMLRRSSKDQIENLYYLKRQTSISQKILLLMLEPLNHLRVTEGEETLMQDLRDQHLKMQTLYSQLLDDINNLLNLTMSFAAQKTNDVVRILTIFSVFFMPLTFIVGIYGMNFEFMPELRQKWGYPAVILLMVVVTIGIYTWFKKQKWL